MNDKSCLGCKYLYGDGHGYSNWTWMETYLTCALNANPNLNGIDMPFDYTSQESDEFEPTKNSRCLVYSEGKFITLDPDREIVLENETDDIEQLLAIQFSDKN